MKNKWSICVFLLGVCLASGCAAMPPVREQVLEQQTKRPVPGALVLGIWRGTKGGMGFLFIPNLADTRDTCYHAALATTDADGWFSFPAVTEPIGYAKSYTSFYFYNDGMKETRVNNSGVPYFMERQTDQRERMADLRGLFYKNCSTDGRVLYLDKTVFLPFRKAIYEEAQRIAVTKGDLLWLENMLFDLDVREFGESEAYRKVQERSDKRFAADVSQFGVDEARKRRVQRAEDARNASQFGIEEALKRSAQRAHDAEREY